MSETSKTVTEKQTPDMIMARATYLIEQLKNSLPQIEELASLSEEARTAVTKQISDFALSIRTTKLKTEELEAFFKKPYVVQPVPGREQTWRLIIPKFMDVQVGWLESQTDSFNIFLINRYVEWIGGIPEEIKRQLGFKPVPDLKLDGEMLVGPRQALDQAWQKYRPFLRNRDEKQILINRKRAFELIAALIKDGILPFLPHPVDPKDFMERNLDFTLRDYQKQAWEEFLKYSNIGVFYPPSTGKTILGLYMATHLKPPHLIVVPTRLLQEQWEARIQAHTDLKLGEEVVVCTYYRALRKYGDKEWTSLTIDEVHHLPSDQFSKLSFIKRKYTMGLSATPFREDKREEYIFTLTGMPVGLSWDYFKQKGLIESPVCNVWIVKNYDAKLSRLKTLIDPQVKTIIFCDHIEIGATLAKRFDVPHIYGETKKGMLGVLEKAQLAVVSRVGDEGLSLPSIGAVIEVDFLYGSRRQSLQRVTRVLHGFEALTHVHHILMTVDEYMHDRKRLFSLMDKGFKVVIHREGVSERTFERTIETTYRAPRHARPLIAYEKEARKETRAMFEKTPEVRYDSPLLQTPGVQRILKRLSQGQANFFSFLLAKDGNWFDQQTLCTHLGYTTPDSFRHAVRPNELVEKGWVKRKDEKGRVSYRTELGGVADTGGQTTP